MPRVKRGVTRRRRHRRILEQAEGYFGTRSTLVRVARETVERAWRYAYRDRRQRKRDLRGLWIVRINAAARANGLSYSRLMAGLKKAGAVLDRKVLAELAATDGDAFARVAETARQALEAAVPATPPVATPPAAAPAAG
jgi:large subunit ribosomal protein L20